MKIFIGYDARQTIAFQVLAHSIYKNASKPVEICRLDISKLPMERKGLTEFTYTRYLVPYLCNYQGEALFLDADMLCLGDVYELEKEAKKNKNVAVSVAPSVERFEWPSLMYFYNDKCKKLTPEYLDREDTKPMTFSWAGEQIGSLPAEWNHVVPYDGKNSNAKIIHFTQGIPCFDETKDCEYSEIWQQYLDEANSTVTWEAIMGGSVHKQRMAL